MLPDLCWQRCLLAALAVVCLIVFSSPAQAKQKKQKKRAVATVALASAAAAPTLVRAGKTKAPAPNGLQAEARLIQIYQLIGQSKTREALKLADKLVLDHPNFALAQLVHGDLLAAQTQPVRALGDVPEATVRAAPGVLTDLREESLLRIRALREKPAAGMLPSNFVRLSARNKHAIAVDASRARLYLFENTAQGLRLVADYYASVGKMGIEKNVEGDLKTPLGIYFVTNTLDPNSLKDLYGAGALPINYPNPYDIRRGKTGSGIWLHGVPQAQFARAPKATDGCVAVSNPDLQDILKRVEIRTTPVVILPKLEWVNPAQTNADTAAFDRAFSSWRSAKAAGGLDAAMVHYSPDFDSYGKKLAEWRGVISSEIAKKRSSELKDVSVLHWAESPSSATMVITFSEVPTGAVSGPTKRQYWLRSAATSNQWKIFFEGIIG
ncbi:L,D-transpeptidase family protein [Variovorax sp. PCZ-1]|uniref:L,D-transpeptidase family protein n=1 Tax=Variovorax sp. PCZ-1 TaxID=2835533 RepID=UPI001BCB70F0|nr:L,D-transpeptidase family protein [Variovorax sp. PCZ-1]MBS7807701.1 L,D-transpeptidase family protein [Variovorax sp. PCZ-1]